MGIDPSQNPSFCYKCNFPVEDCHTSSVEEHISNANNCLEELMEKTEELLNKCDNYLEISTEAKKLNGEAAQLRKEGFKNRSSNAYIEAVKVFEKNAIVQLQELQRKFVDLKIKRVKDESAATAKIQAIKIRLLATLPNESIILPEIKALLIN